MQRAILADHEIVIGEDPLYPEFLRPAAGFGCMKLPIIDAEFGQVRPLPRRRSMVEAVYGRRKYDCADSSVVRYWK